ncbi:MAG: NAD(P)H-hydrate dehydratase [Spirochaetota bacterium]
MRLVTTDAMQDIDRRARDEYGIPGLVLMESAGLQAWQELQARLADSAPRICFVAGKGNNGGDALVMARYAIGKGYPTSVVLAAGLNSLGEQAGLHAAIVRELGVEPVVWPEAEAGARELISAADVIVDGLSGTGIRGALRAPLDAMAAAINEATGVVACVDAPSGLSDSWTPEMPVVRATLTLTMGLPKACLYLPAARPECGEVVVVPVSFPRALLDDPAIPGELIGAGDLRTLLPPLAVDAYKHRRGVVAVFAGNVGTTGASVLAAEGAQRCRAGLVTIYADREVYPIIASSVRAVMARPFDSIEDAAAALEAVGTDAAVIGPGWGISDERQAHLRDLVGRVDRGVLDADAITLFARLADPPRLDDRWVLTPHPGELARALGRASADVRDRFFDAAAELARRTGAVVAAKSHVLVVAHPDGRYAVVDGVNPTMGTGGTGDVLAGAIGGLLAGGMDGWRAARAAAVVHQEAGRRLRERVGVFVADELAAELAAVADTRDPPGGATGGKEPSGS